MAALTQERVVKFIAGCKDVAEKADALRGLINQIQASKAALSQQMSALHTDYPALVPGNAANTRILGEDFSPAQLNQLLDTFDELEKFFNGLAVATGTHGDRIKRISKVVV